MIVGILGGGVMARGIFSLCSINPDIEKLYIWIRNKENIEVVADKVNGDIKRLSRKKEVDYDSIISKLVFTDSLLELRDVDLFIEAVSEDYAVKSEVISCVNKVAKSGSIFSSNTSSLSITALSMSFKYPENFIGMHFFNPVSMMNLVEIVKGLNTSQDVIDQILNLSISLDKAPVLVNESPGFIVNRMLIPMINEAISILAEGVAKKEDIDKAMKLGANHPLGPLSLADLIGNDVCLSIMESLHEETGDPKYRAHPLLRRYVRAGFLGRKVNKGFYSYAK
ncbi:3-hydroxybutyryl-CoA dehydrogenase [Oceaniserpentilla sp. 4NH20-0058]|uniref:3-hydroxyacyl-CoA dehydrogenase NAD-binding domain-containing protein n=1 Tax=Oceaniserpentilla sp. 4NH20-0058 TaxID=3127660 RepID=UPI0031084EE6